MHLESGEEVLRRVVCPAELLLANGNCLNIPFPARFNEANRIHAEFEWLQ